MMNEVWSISPWYVVGIVFVLVWMALLYTKRQPEVSSMREFVGLVNSRGGVILVLTTLSIYFFNVAVKLFYFILSLVREGKLTEQNAIALMALQFVTASAFGSAFGALLSVMTGSDSRNRSADGRQPPNGAPPAELPKPPEVPVPSPPGAA